MTWQPEKCQQENRRPVRRIHSPVCIPTQFVRYWAALGGEIHGLSGSVVEGEGQLGQAGGVGGQASGESVTSCFAHTDPVRSVLGAVGFEPALHPDMAALGFPDFD